MQPVNNCRTYATSSETSLAQGAYHAPGTKRPIIAIMGRTIRRLQQQRTTGSGRMEGNNSVTCWQGQRRARVGHGLRNRRGQGRGLRLVRRQTRVLELPIDHTFGEASEVSMASTLGGAINGVLTKYKSSLCT